jgi:hypothetical protein
MKKNKDSILIVRVDKQRKSILDKVLGNKTISQWVREQMEKRIKRG